MVFGLDFLWTDDALHNAFFVNDEGRAEGAHVLASIHALLSPYTKLFDQLLVCVGNQGKGREFFSMNFWCDFSLSTLTPTTS